MAKYRELRERYHGSHTYDFGEFILISASQDLWQAGEQEAVLAFGKLNAAGRALDELTGGDR